MRINGTKYEELKTLPNKAKPVSQYATEKNMQVGYVYIKHDRHFDPKDGKNPGEYPGYIIRQFKGTNYVIPD